MLVRRARDTPAPRQGPVERLVSMEDACSSQLVLVGRDCLRMNKALALVGQEARHGERRESGCQCGVVDSGSMRPSRTRQLKRGPEYACGAATFGIKQSAAEHNGEDVEVTGCTTRRVSSMAQVRAETSSWVRAWDLERNPRSVEECWAGQLVAGQVAGWLSS